MGTWSDYTCVTSPDTILPYYKASEWLGLVKSKSLRRKGVVHQQSRIPPVPLFLRLLRTDGSGISM